MATETVTAKKHKPMNRTRMIQPIPRASDILDLLEQIRDHGDRLAYRYYVGREIRTMTYGELYTMVNELAAAMDMETTLLSERLIESWVKETGCCLILVTHSLQQARRIADDVLYFHAGKLLEHDRAEKLLSEPKLAETRQFLDFYGI